MCFDFLYKFFRAHFSFKEELKEIGCFYKCTQAFTQSTRYSCKTLMKVTFSRQILEKYSKFKVHKNPVHWVLSFSPLIQRKEEA